MNLDHALAIYSEKLEIEDNIDLGYFQKELSQKDYLEFVDLIQYINILSNTKISNKFEKLFNEMNEYKLTIHQYQEKAVANFRKSKDAKTDEAEKVIEDTFNEIFDDE